MLPDVQALKQTLNALIISMTQYDEESPHVSGTKRLLRRMQKEAEIVDHLVQQGEAANIVRISGAVNNVRGLQGELATAQQVPGVIALGRRFTARIAAGQAALLDIQECSMPVLVPDVQSRAWPAG